MRDLRPLRARQSHAPDSTWRSQGRCLELDPELFFPAPADNPTAAVRVCPDCTVAGPCLASALDSGELNGVWNSTTLREHRVMRRVWQPASTASTRIV